ncbi:MAG: hypothetical protein Q8J63_06790 [Candidatus Aquicultor sp.]|nr:hypothetical protein [Candidatus Aquicultor sp.]
MNTPIIPSRNRILSKKAAIISLIIVIAACSLFLFKVISVPTVTSVKTPAPVPIDPATKKLAQEESIREAVYRHQFENNASGQRKSAKAYFLSLGTVEKPSDPSDELMGRFKNHKPL